jgi:hypothetical protein
MQMKVCQPARARFAMLLQQWYLFTVCQQKDNSITTRVSTAAPVTGGTALQQLQVHPAALQHSVLYYSASGTAIKLIRSGSMRCNAV